MIAQTEKMRYYGCVVAKSITQIWRSGITMARVRCHKVPLFFREHAPLYKIAGCMGRLPSLPGSIVTGSPTLCSPLSVFGETVSDIPFNYGENYYG